MALPADLQFARAIARHLPTPRRYAVLIPSSAGWKDAAGIAGSLRASGALVSVESLNILTTVVPGPLAADASAEFSELCFVVLMGCTPTDAQRAVKRARAMRPGIPLVAVINLTPEAVRALLAATVAGIDDVVLLGYDDVVQCAALLYTRASINVATRKVLAVLTPELTPVGIDLIDASLQLTGAVPDAARLAMSLGISYRTLVRRFAEAKLPTPALVIAWTRILTAAYIACTVRCSTAMLARQIGYSSSRSLREVVRRHTGLSLAALREPATFPRLCRRFAALLHESHSHDQPASPVLPRATAE